MGDRVGPLRHQDRRQPAAGAQLGVTGDDCVTLVIVFEPSCPFCQVKCSSKPSVPVFLPCQQIKVSCSSSRNCYQILTTAFFKFVCNLCGRALKAGSLSGPGAGGAGVVTVNLGLK